MSELNSIQTSVMASEINLAKVMATKSINTTNEYINEILSIKSDIVKLNTKIDDLIIKVNNLTKSNNKT